MELYFIHIQYLKRVKNVQFRVVCPSREFVSKKLNLDARL